MFRTFGSYILFSRLYVATFDIDRLVDYVKNTPPDNFRTGKSVDNIIELIKKNKEFTG